MQYPGHWLRTRRQARWQNVVLLTVLLPLATWRATTQPLGVGIGLLLLTLAPFVIAYQTSRVLDAQEHVHGEPTPEMIFLFRFVASTPLTLGAILFVVLVNLR